MQGPELLQKPIGI